MAKKTKKTMTQKKPPKEPKPPKAPKEKKTKDARYSKRRRGLLFAILATALIALSIVGACTVFFQVETVTVTGNERYSEQQILDVASVEMGANMILTPSEQIAQRLYDGLPYLHEVRVHKRFPTTLRLEITECQPAAVITGAASAWLVDANGKLLEPADETMQQEYPNVTGLELLEPKQGTQAATTDENQSKLKGLVALMQAMTNGGLMDGVTAIDVSSGTEIQVVYDGRLTIKLLNNANFEKKMQPLRTVIAVAGDDARGIINMKGSDKIIWTKQN